MNARVCEHVDFRLEQVFQILSEPDEDAVRFMQIVHRLSTASLTGRRRPCRMCSTWTDSPSMANRIR